MFSKLGSKVARPLGAALNYPLTEGLVAPPVVTNPRGRRIVGVSPVQFKRSPVFIGVHNSIHSNHRTPLTLSRIGNNSDFQEKINVLEDRLANAEKSNDTTKNLKKKTSTSNLHSRDSGDIPTASSAAGVDPMYTISINPNVSRVWTQDIITVFTNAGWKREGFFSQGPFTQTWEKEPTPDEKRKAFKPLVDGLLERGIYDPENLGFKASDRTIIEELRDKWIENKAAIEKKKKEAEGFVTKVSTLEDQVTELKNRVVIEQQRADAAQRNLSNATNQLDSYQQRSERLQTEISLAQDTHDAELADLRARHAIDTAEGLARYEKQAAALVIKHTTEMNELRGELDELNLSVADLQGELAQQKGQLTEANQKVGQLELNLTAAGKEHDTLMARLNAQGALTEGEKAKNAQLQQLLDAQALQIQTASSEIVVLKFTNSHLLSRVDSLQEEIKAKDLTIQNQAAEIAALKRQLAASAQLVQSNSTPLALQMALMEIEALKGQMASMQTPLGQAAAPPPNNTGTEFATRARLENNPPRHASPAPSKWTHIYGASPNVSLAKINFDFTTAHALNEEHKKTLEDRKALPVSLPSGHKYTLFQKEGAIPKAVLMTDDVPDKKNDENLAKTMINMIDNVLAKGTVVKVDTQDPFLAEIAALYIDHLKTTMPRFKIDAVLGTTHPDNEVSINSIFDAQDDARFIFDKLVASLNKEKLITLPWFKEAEEFRLRQATTAASPVLTALVSGGTPDSSNNEDNLKTPRYH